QPGPRLTAIGSLAREDSGWPGGQLPTKRLPGSPTYPVGNRVPQRSVLTAHEQVNARIALRDDGWAVHRDPDRRWLQRFPVCPTAILVQLVIDQAILAANKDVQWREKRYNGIITAWRKGKRLNGWPRRGGQPRLNGSLLVCQGCLRDRNFIHSARL